MNLLLGKELWIFLVAAFVVAISVYSNWRGYHLLRTMQQKNLEQAKILKNVEELNSQIRAHRHDFLNHIQIVYGLIEMEEYKEAIAYLKKTYGEIERSNGFAKTKDLAINALLQAKYNHALRRNIDFFVYVSSSLEGLTIPSWEMCRILGNLLDNALYAAEHSKQEKMVKVTISDQENEFIFAIENSGDPIPKAIFDTMFFQNITTKSESGQGMGLYIVKQLTENYGAKLEVISQTDKTEFVLKVPKEA